MANMYELAEFLMSSLKLASTDSRVPTSHGILDVALHRVRDQLPERFKNALSFGNTRLGFRCYELPQILYCAQANLLTSQPNPTYLTTEIQISADTAYLLLFKLGLDTDKAADFGKALSKAIAQVAEADKNFAEVGFGSAETAVA